jgi:hypothetical protein
MGMCIIFCWGDEPKSPETPKKEMKSPMENYFCEGAIDEANCSVEVFSYLIQIPENH